MRSFPTDMRGIGIFFVAALAASTVLAEAGKQSYAPYPNPDAGYVTDLAGLLSAAEEERIEQWLIRVEEQTGAEVIVVTIDSIGRYPGTENRSIEAFATALFNRWGIGNLPKNDGMLLLVAKSDRKARIELGAGYDASHDRKAEAIMRDEIVPRFRKGDFAGGITQGVKSMVNEVTPARIGFPWKLVALPVAILVLLLSGISLIRQGKRGWGWVLIGLALILVVLFLHLLFTLLRSRGNSSGWAAGGSGGFGGGFSSGGGATGSW